MVTRQFEGIEIVLEEVSSFFNEQIRGKVLTLESIPRDIETILLDFTVKNRNGSVLDYTNHLIKMRNTFLTIYQKH